MANNLPALLSNDVIKNRFNEVLGKNAAGFMSALLNIYNNNQQLQNCDARSILGAAGLAATLNLSITPSLGQAYVVPFKGKAQFQIGFKGLIQLAHRSERFLRLHAGKIFEGEIKSFNPLTGEPERGDKISDTVVGYIAYMKLVNGFEKYLYMSLAEIEAHAEKYSQSYSYDKRSGKKTSPWSTNFDAMASKTVLKKLLSTWGRLSIELVNAIQGDQSVVDKSTFTYVDNGGDSQNRDEIFIGEVDEETGELKEAQDNGTNDNDEN